MSGILHNMGDFVEGISAKGLLDTTKFQFGIDRRMAHIIRNAYKNTYVILKSS